MSKIARTTISIPTELKRKMERVKEPTNWSAIAARAFAAKVADPFTEFYEETTAEKTDCAKLTEAIDNLAKSIQDIQIRSLE